MGAKADDANGMAGAAPGVTVLPVRVLGKCYGDSADIQAAMRWAAGISVPGVPDNPNPAKVLNLSLGGSSSTCSAGYQSAVNEVLARGVVIVAAAGNSAGGPVGSPANCTGVIAVAGLRHAGTKVGFPIWVTQIGIAAPAGNCINVTSGSPCLYPVLAATNSGAQGPNASGWTDSYNITVGTSFASPLVAATAALMFSVQPALTPAQLLAQMQATARPFPTTGGDNGDGSVVPQCMAPRTGVDQLQCYCNTTYCGAGMLDAGRAVAAAAGAVARITVTTGQPHGGQRGGAVGQRQPARRRRARWQGYAVEPDQRRRHRHRLQQRHQRQHRHADAQRRRQLHRDADRHRQPRQRGTGQPGGDGGRSAGGAARPPHARPASARRRWWGWFDVACCGWPRWPRPWLALFRCAVPRAGSRRADPGAQGLKPPASGPAGSSFRRA